jgi:carbohydrate-binding DOMON domain-containing protein
MVPGALIKQQGVSTVTLSLPIDNPVLAFLYTSHAQNAVVTVTQTATQTTTGLFLTTQIASSIRTIEPQFLNEVMSPVSLVLIGLIAVDLILVVAILIVPKREKQTAAAKIG